MSRKKIAIMRGPDGKIRMTIKDPRSAKSPFVTASSKVKSRPLVFGSVMIEVIEPSAAVARRNIRAGQKALARALPTILKPGVKIDVRKDVPLFHVDSENPKLIVRRLNGKEEKGTFVGSKFKIMAAK